MKNPPTTVKQSSSNGLFFLCLALFVASACAFAFVMKLDRKIEKTAGKVIETYTKKAFASRKRSFEQEYAVVRYTVGGKEHTATTKKRTTSDLIPVYYYKDFPTMAWYYKKANPNMVYCCIAMALSLLGVILARPRFKKPETAANVKTQQKKK
jgi:hypothetical protein